MSPRPTVFIDRDGTLMEEVHYCSRPEDVKVFRGVPEALDRLKAAGFLTIIVTNQSGIGRGVFSEADFHRVQEELLRQIGPGRIDATYFCPDHPDSATVRRKPGIGMIEEACGSFPIDLAQSWMIGDKAIDVDCGKNAGLRTVLVATGYGKSEDCAPDYRARDFVCAVEWLLGEEV